MGPDLVEIGFAVDTSGMEKGAKQSEEFLNKLSEGFKNGKVSVDEFGQALDKLPVTNQIEVLQKLGLTAEDAAKRVKAATDASRELSAEGSASKNIFQSLLSALTGYGTAHKEASEEVEEHTEKIVAHGHAHHATTEAIHVFREGLYALRPAFADVGIALNEATKFSMAARQGFIALAAAVVGTFIVEIVRTGSEIEKLHKQFGDTFGVTGPEMFEKTQAAAESLHTTVARLAPSIDTVYSALRRNQIEQQQELKKSFETEGISFAPGAAGEAAAERMASLNMSSLAGSNSKIGKELQSLIDIFKGLGQNAGDAESKATEFFASIPKNAEQARAAAISATADFTKLFEVSGMGSDNAAKATQKFFEEVKKGGLTSGTFDGITKESREAARAIAEAFGFTGPEAVEKFGATLDTVGRLTFPEFIAGLNKSHDDIEKLVVPPSVAGSWSKFKEAFFDVFDALAEGLGGKGGKGATAFLDELAKGLKESEPGLVKFEQAVLGVFSKIKEGTGPLIKAMQGLKELYDWADARASQTSKPGEPTNLGGMDPNPTGIPPFDWIARFAASSAVGMGIPPVTVDNVVTGMENGPGGAATNQPKFETGSASIGAVIGQLDDAMGKTEQAATGAATDTVALAGGITDVGTSSETAKGSISTFSDALKQSGEGYVLLSQGIATAVGDAESQLGSFFSWLSQKASEVANTTSGGEGGPSFDTGSSADIGNNAVGGIYTIGASGGVASGGTKASGTDTIKLTGTVSPGEVIAVIPADKANQATLNQLQSVINESPISIGGGTVSGLGAVNASELVAAIAGSGGVGYPTSLSDPQTKSLLAQIAALVSGKGGPAAATAATAAGLGFGAGGANIKFQDNKDDKKHPPEEQSSRASHQPSSGAAPAARAASKVGSQRFDVHPQKGEAGDSSFDNQMFPEGPVGGPSDMTFGAFASSSYDLPYNNQFFDPYSAYGGNDVQPVQTSYGQAYDSQFYDPYSAGAFGDNFSAGSAYSSSTGSSYTPDYGSDVYSSDFYSTSGATDFYSGNVVDIGANATGGIYTVKGTGGSEPGYSGHNDTMNLTGTVSPGEMVAVIPADKATDATVSQLQNLISNSSINVGGAHGGAATLNLSNDQITALLAKIAALMAAKAGTTPATSLGGTGLAGPSGGGFNTQPDQKKPPPKEEQPSRPASSASQGASQSSRAASKSPASQRFDVHPQQTGGGDQMNAGDLHGGDGGFTDSSGGFSGLGAYGASSYELPYDSQFFDPYSAYGGNDVQSSLNSYDNAYDSQFYSPYSAGSGGDNFSADTAYSSTAYGDTSYQPDWANTFTDYTGGATSDAGIGSGPGSSGAPGEVSANDYVSAGFDAFDAGSYAHGGSFTVPNVPGGGTDTVDTKLHLTGGEEVGVFPAGSSPSMSALTGSGDSTGSYYGNLALNAQSNIPADQNPSAGQPTTVNVFGAANVQEFLQSRMAIQRALRVTG